MPSLYEQLISIDTDGSIEKEDMVKHIRQATLIGGYTLAEVNSNKPWGAYLRIEDGEADRFTPEMFEGMSSEEARRGVADAPLSPKILLVSPGQRLSEQRHNRRAERWHFLTPGFYVKSKEVGDQTVYEAKPGDIVQYDQAEVHRLIGSPSAYTIVAEVWQHSDATHPSDEDDIERFADDYVR